jgi:uncharacterized membrane protein
MEFLGPFHPQITHGPIVLIIVGLLFEVAGRALDRDWWRKAAFAMLILGVVGAYLAVQSGEGASEVVEKQGVPEHTVDAHGDLGKLALWFGLGAVVARAVAGRLGPVRGAVSALGLALHLAAAVAVGIAAHRGGQLVFEHAANVRLHGALVSPGPPGSGKAAAGEHAGEEHESGGKR